jgi:hypothetical protein
MMTIRRDRARHPLQMCAFACLVSGVRSQYAHRIDGACMVPNKREGPRFTAASEPPTFVALQQVHNAGILRHSRVRKKERKSGLISAGLLLVTYNYK